MKGTTEERTDRGLATRGKERKRAEEGLSEEGREQGRGKLQGIYPDEDTGQVHNKEPGRSRVTI